MRRTSIVAGVLAASLAVVALGAGPAPLGPGTTDIRAAVTRSLPLLQSSADTWFQKRQCASCHHQALGLIAITVARERGFPVDEALVRGQLERTLRPGRNWQEKFVTGEVSINEAIGQSYRAVGVGTAGGIRTQMTDAMSYLLAGRQHLTGRWPSYSRRPPLEDSEFTATALTIRALKLFPLKGREAELDDRVARARAWLMAAPPADAEDRSMQLLGLAWAGTPATDLAPMANTLMAEQRADGGWAQIATRQSDAYATGLALVALNQAARVPLDSASLQRGLGFLVRTQQTDGSWRVPTRRTWRDGLPYFESGYPHGPDQFISYSGAAWATSALALSLQDAVSPALMGAPPATGRASGETNEPDGLTPLMRAALYGTTAELDVLIGSGQDVNAASADGITALMCAVHDPAKVTRLLAVGANPAAETRTGHTAVLLAAGYAGARGSVDLLVARGVPVDRPAAIGNMPGATPLARALMRGDIELAAALVSRGARIERVMPKGLSPLMIATWHGDAPVVRWLVGQGARVDDSYSDEMYEGTTALMGAVEDGRTAVVDVLLGGGADVNKVDGSGHAALAYAAVTIDRGTPEIVDRLLVAGARPGSAVPVGEKDVAALARRWGKPYMAERLEMKR